MKRCVRHNHFLGPLVSSIFFFFLVGAHDSLSYLTWISDLVTFFGVTPIVLSFSIKVICIFGVSFFFECVATEFNITVLGGELVWWEIQPYNFLSGCPVLDMHV